MIYHCFHIERYAFILNTVLIQGGDPPKAMTYPLAADRYSLFTIENNTN